MLSLNDLMIAIFTILGDKKYLIAFSLNYNIKMENKNKLLKSLYYDQSGFQSIAKLYKEAKQKDNTITQTYVKKWRDENLGITRQSGGTNSFVAPHAFFEFEIDLFFITDLENQKYGIGLACIDVFSKFASVIPLKSKQPPDVLAGLMEAFQKMKGKPEFLRSDEEGSLQSNDIQGYLKSQKIKLITTRGHTNFCERFIRTFKDMLYKRLKYFGKEQNQWHELIYPILLTYNNKNEHSTIKMIPANAHKK
jgi:hypothetical protein